MSSKKIAVISLIVSSILWASSGTVAKILLPSIDPIPLMALRIGIGISILIPLYLFRPHKPFIQTFRDTWPAILGATGNFLFFILGVSLTTANAAGIIYTITPLLTLFLAKKTIQELYTPRRLYGILLGLFGVVGIMLLPVIEGHASVSGDPLGNILILCAALCWTLYIVSSRNAISKKGHEPLAVTTFSMSGAFILFLLITLSIPHRPFLSIALAGFHPWLLLYYGALVTAVTFLIHQWAIKHSSATTASLTNYLQPIFAFIYNGVFIGEKLTFGFIIGSMFVLVGTFLATSEQAYAYKKSLKRK